MKIDFAFSQDEWGRARLSADLLTEEPVRVLAYATFQDKMWWAKSGKATTEQHYSALYHHVRSEPSRQVIVNCGSIIQDCAIPSGLDPCAGASIELIPMVPCTLYQCGPHSLGILLVPQSATKSMRNGIWRLRSDRYSAELEPYREPLSHGRIGKSSGIVHNSSLKLDGPDGPPT